MTDKKVMLSYDILLLATIAGKIGLRYCGNVIKSISQDQLNETESRYKDNFNKK